MKITKPKKRKKKIRYEVEEVIGDIAVISTEDQCKYGLANLKTHEIIIEPYECHVESDKDGKWIILTKEYYSSGDYNFLLSKPNVTIYDVLEEKIIVDGWEAEQRHAGQKDGVIYVLKSPESGKMSLFNTKEKRAPHNLFDVQLDSAKLLCICGTDRYLIIEIGSKKGLYYSSVTSEDSKMVAPIDYDDIYLSYHHKSIVIFENNGKKSFASLSDVSQIKGEFDEIVNNDKLIFCKKGAEIYVYHNKTKELLIQTTADDIKCLHSDVVTPENDGYCNSAENYFFEMTTKGHASLMHIGISHTSNGENKIFRNPLLLPEYDSITYRPSKIKGRYRFYTKKEDQNGVLIWDKNRSPIHIQRKCDRIEALDENLYAFYKSGKCDIVEITSLDHNTIYRNCNIISNKNKTIIFEKNGKYGLLNYEKGPIIIAIGYDAIEELEMGYFLVEQNGKKGVMHSTGKIVIPVEYDEITFKIAQKQDQCFAYFSLKKDGEYQLAKETRKEGIQDGFSLLGAGYQNIQLLKDIIVFQKDNNYTLIYNYEEQLLEFLPPKTIIGTTPKPDAKSKDDYYYTIDGIYYFYANGKLHEVPAKTMEYYVATIETDTACFKLSADNENEINEFVVSEIEAKKDDQKVESYLEWLSHGTIPSKYPTLTLRKTQKKSE